MDGRLWKHNRLRLMPLGYGDSLGKCSTLKLMFLACVQQQCAATEVDSVTLSFGCVGTDGAR